MSQMQQWRLAAIPQGMPQDSDFTWESAAVPACPPGGLLVRTHLLSVDPYIRGRLNGVKTYVDPIPVGQLLESSAVGAVVESRAAGFAPGDFVVGFWPWAEYAAVPAAAVYSLGPQPPLPIQHYLDQLGAPGMTAWFGLTEICQPKAGETVFVTAAAGAVGFTVAQIAKLLGCRVVGTAGTAAKVADISKYCDAAFSYRDEARFAELLATTCPAGIDCFFDNTGGPLTDAVLQHMNPFGRIAVCGQISAYNDARHDIGPRPFLPILTKQLRVEGFIVTRWRDRFPEGQQRLGEWLRAGKLHYRWHEYSGLAAAPRALRGLFTGENHGKSLVWVFDHRPEPLFK
jgi:NADPH-dependent curcumin reductase CurA